MLTFKIEIIITKNGKSQASFYNGARCHNDKRLDKRTNTIKTQKWLGRNKRIEY